MALADAESALTHAQRGEEKKRQRAGYPVLYLFDSMLYSTHLELDPFHGNPTPIIRREGNGEQGHGDDGRNGRQGQRVRRTGHPRCRY